MSYPINWIYEITCPDFRRSWTKDDVVFVEKMIKAGIWTYSHDDLTVKNSDYWKAEYYKNRENCSDMFEEMRKKSPTSKIDKRTKLYRDYNMSVKLLRHYQIIIELYYRRECIKEGMVLSWNKGLHDDGKKVIGWL